MITFTYYNEENNVDEVWYDSSSIVYSKYVQDSLELEVVFKGGSTYMYYRVPVMDYLMFKNGGNDGSQGKSLNKFVKGKYDYNKIEPSDLSILEAKRKMYEEIKNVEFLRENTYFISGHRNITEEEFRKNYKDEIDKILVQNVEEENARFVIGDYYGVDIMAQNYLLDEMEYNPDRVFVYHMFEKPRNVNPKVIHLVGGFETDEERDAAMTAASGHDIAFVRNHLELSGTAMNLLRRRRLK